MEAFLIGALFAVSAGFAALVMRAMRARAAEARTLLDELKKVSARIEPLEQEMSRISLRADVAETVLLEKGIADEEDLEEARRFFEEHGQPRYLRERDGNLH